MMKKCLINIVLDDCRKRGVEDTEFIKRYLSICYDISVSKEVLDQRLIRLKKSSNLFSRAFLS